MNKFLVIILLAIFPNISCKKNTEILADTIPPQVVGTNPQHGAKDVILSTEITIEYDENIRLAKDFRITINETAHSAVADSKKITITASLKSNSAYTVKIAANSVRDIAGNFAPEFIFSFTTAPASELMVEAENARFNQGLQIQKTIAGYSGLGYIGNFTNTTDSLVFVLEDIANGYYDLFIAYSTSNWGSKVCRVDVNGSIGEFQLPSSSGFKQQYFSKIKLKSGTNKITITPSWTYFAIDYIRLVPNKDPIIPFAVDATLVTLNPSVQAVKVYNFLKEKFGSRIIAGTMAAHATNIAEAKWVFDNTGKWPALTCFDYIDYTNPGANWVDYSAIYSLGSNWWQQNGLVGIMWHWRDPLNKSGAFYTKDTNFDVSKILDTNSPEYKAMLSDIDTIAGYLREFRNAGIPVIWRPLHEAAGGWFWWGAKGAAPCKALWRIMFDRMVNHHRLNNLIWVWTTNSHADALDWYPGDNYTDILGMDLYPGENKHGSQYLEFEKVKDIFKGKKMIALSECGSVPDPALMMEYGDTWSWFMPWNGDYNRSNAHNGAAWWNKFFSYDYVISRDKMPSLK
jgi:mannan endo-1,4-beta-mannosidase